MPSPYFYASEKFSVARRALMLPHRHGEAASIADAFFNCSLGLEDVTTEHLSPQAAKWVARIRELMDTKGIEDGSGGGSWRAKAELLSDDDKTDLSNAVDELAFFFDERAQLEL